MDHWGGVHRNADDFGACVLQGQGGDSPTHIVSIGPDQRDLSRYRYTGCLCALPLGYWQPERPQNVGLAIRYFELLFSASEPPHLSAGTAEGQGRGSEKGGGPVGPGAEIVKVSGTISVISTSLK